MFYGAHLGQDVVASLVHLVVIEAPHKLYELVELARSDCDAWVERAAVKDLLVGTLGRFGVVFVWKDDLVILWVLVKHLNN